MLRATVSVWEDVEGLVSECLVGRRNEVLRGGDVKELSDCVGGALP